MKYPISKPSITELERSLVQEALERVHLSQGPYVKRFERMLAEYIGTNYAIATTSGTTALHLVLASLGIGPGDEVLVPALTFVATVNAVRYTGATPVLVDVDPVSWCMSTRDAETKITPNTRAILPVHLYGVPCDMFTLRHFAFTYNLHLVEDAAEGLGGEYAGFKLGGLSDAGVFSFYGNKVVTCGEGGAVVTDDEALYRRMYFLRGQALDPKRRYYHPELGFNYRMTDLQAAVGVGQMLRLENMLERRREIFELYQTRLCDHVGTAPSAPRHSTRTAPWVFTIQLNNRDALMARLAERGVETRPGFVPLHWLPMYPTKYPLPVAEELAGRIISLPTYVDMTDDDVHSICDEVIREL